MCICKASSLWEELPFELGELSEISSEAPLLENKSKLLCSMVLVITL